MSFFQDILGTLANSVLAWGANIAVFTAFLCLTGRFWQRNAAPALRRAGYTVAVYLSFIVLPKITSPLCALLHICFPGAVPEAVGALLWLPTAGRTPLPALRATDWALLAALLWLLGALACAAARLLPCWRFGKWLRANRRPLGKRAARVLQRAEEQLRAAGGAAPGRGAGRAAWPFALPTPHTRRLCGGRPPRADVRKRPSRRRPLPAA